jgi:hypothetical protein
MQAARKAAAERFQAVAAKYTPPGLEVRYRNNLTGCAELGVISVPPPTTRWGLHIYLHEIAHIALGHVVASGKHKPRHAEEYEAERWATKVMRAEGIPVPRKTTEFAKGYVAHMIRQAKNRGAKRIDRKAAAFAKVRRKRKRADRASVDASRVVRPLLDPP